jgi:DNA-binding transcriptional regulator YbjK
MYSDCKYERTGTLLSVTRAEASQRVRDAIVAATVRIVAAEGVAAVTHRRVASEASVSLSSTTWHYAALGDILAAALEWCARREVGRIGAIASRLAVFDLAAWTDELADWIVEQVTVDRESTVALYRLQAELLGSPGALELHREWGDGLRAVGSQALDVVSDVDVRLIIAALDGLRFAALNADDLSWVRPAVQRQLSALLG